MAAAAPIGREREFDALRAAASKAASGRGAIVFLGGSTGSGKSFLLKALADALRPDGTEVVTVRCYETSAGNPLGPFGEVLRALTSRERRADRAKRVLELVAQVAPPLVELIPVIGKLASLGVKAAADAGVYALGGDHQAQQAERAADVALALRHIATEIPLVVAVDDAHWIDAPSTEVITRLSERDDDAEQSGLLLLVAYDEDLVDDGHPLTRVRGEALIRSAALQIKLDDFGRDAIEAVLRRRYGEIPAPRLADWLLDRTDGSPLFVEQYLTMLEEQGVLQRSGDGWSLAGTIGGGPGDWRLSGALAQVQTPYTLLELMRPRVADLDDDDRALLESGAVQGRRFLSAVIVKLLDREEDAISDRLRQLQSQRHMIVIEEADDWWSDHSTLYAFDPGVLQELLYSRETFSTYERRRPPSRGRGGARGADRGRARAAARSAAGDRAPLRGRRRPSGGRPPTRRGRGVDVRRGRRPGDGGDRRARGRTAADGAGGITGRGGAQGRTAAARAGDRLVAAGR